MTGKNEMREIMRIRRGRLSPRESAERGAEVQRRAIESAPFRNSASIAVYLPLRGEVPTGEIVDAARRQGKRVAAPSSRIANGDYRFAWLDVDTETAPARYGIEEAVDPREAAPEEIDLVILPGLAFDRRGGRLGQGAGVYDRLLLDFAGGRLGFAFDFQLVEQVPRAAHDLAVDYLATESDFLFVNRNRKQEGLRPHGERK